ncbi:MAG: acetolactate synthase large subunit [Gammaproteobacteria bacterium]|nr:acetolactate synthase large subunit [Gammaproteobacteria bacterium]MDE0443000.1 acetolactate synthase large subunit [Gammaproteobacteria bacterium]
MNGAESVIRTLMAHGVDTCFANPGTSEMHLVQAIDGVPESRAILCLFEGVCTGAADGYGRMKGVPATTLLHLGAGLGNGIANLHNCRRAGTPLVNIIGDHAIHHVAYDAPLTSDIEAVAKPVSNWIRTSRTSDGAGLDAADAVRAALAPNPDPRGGISTLILPADCAWGPGRVAPKANGFEAAVAKARVPTEVIESAARQIDADTMLFVDGNGLGVSGVTAAGRIAARTGCSVYSPTFPARVEAGPDLPLVNRLPYFPEQILQLLGTVRRLVLVGAERPVSFFAYQNLPSDLVPEGCEVIRVAHRHEDVARALADMAETLAAPPAETPGERRPEVPDGPLRVRSIAAILAARAPDNCIVAVDSGGGGAAYGVLQRCVRHTWLNLTGGSIGQGGPAAVGAAVACPDRPVLALLGDGGAMYTNQFLWTAARENLDLVSVIFSNRQYNILEVEYRRLGVNEIGERAASLFDLSGPDLDWVALANAQGVAGTRAETGEEFDKSLCDALAEGGPHLIEAVL